MPATGQKYTQHLAQGRYREPHSITFHDEASKLNPTVEILSDLSELIDELIDCKATSTSNISGMEI